MFCAQLEGSGIPGTVTDDHTVSTDWMLSNAVGGVKVKVPEDYVQEAIELFNDFRREEIEEQKEKNKGKHSFDRYIKMAGILMLFTFVLTLVWNSDYSFQGAVMSAVSGVFIGGGIAFLCGLLDI